MQSGIALISMSKNDVEMNPLLSYICINGYELYVTYPGQAITCKYCGEIGHIVAILSKGKEKLFLLLPFFHHFVIFFR